MSDPVQLHKRQVSMEEAFFLEQERKILDRRRAQRKLEETRQDLAAASGIRNEAILEKLLALNVRPETLASLALAPLIEVAWCDGEVTAEERKAVLEASRKQAGAGAAPHELSQDLLAQWLTHRPDPNLFAAWEQYVQGLCELLTPEDRRALRQEILAHANLVARASGGILGLATISAAESACLARIEAAFA